MRILMLGGTGFIGPCFVREAVDRGHEVTVFNRGRTPVDLPRRVGRIVGDRIQDLEPLKGRNWDAAVDFAVYAPGPIRHLIETVGDAIGHYTYISTTGVYVEDPATVGDESSPLKTYEGDPFAPDPFDYGQLKAECEHEIARHWADRSLILRPTGIFGPGNGTFNFLPEHWMLRFAEGGRIIGPGAPSDPLQGIDARDLAAWAIRMIEVRELGAYNAFGSTTWGEFLGAINATRPTPAEITWIPSEWLLKRVERLWSLPLWAPYPDRPATEVPDAWYSYRRSNDKAVARGLTFRPIEETVADTVEHVRATRPARREGVGFAPGEEQRLLDEWDRENGRSAKQVAS